MLEIIIKALTIIVGLGAIGIVLFFAAFFVALCVMGNE